MILIDENTLLLRIANGDEKAFANLYERYFSEVKGFIQKFVKSGEHAEDICQEIFLKIWDDKENIAAVNSFKSYLFVLARNQSFNFLKHAAVEQTAQSEILRNVSQMKNYTDEEFQTTEYLQYLDKVLSQIPVRSREVFELCRIDGNSYDDTAEMLGISNNAVKKHMVRTMKIIKFSIHKDFGLSFMWGSVVALFTAN